MKVSARIALLVFFLISFTRCAPQGGSENSSPTNAPDPLNFSEPKVSEASTYASDPFPGVGTESASAMQSFDPYQQMMAQNGSSSDGSPFPPTAPPTDGSSSTEIPGQGGSTTPKVPSIPEWTPGQGGTTVPQTGQQPPYSMQPNLPWNGPADTYMAGQVASGFISLGMMMYNIVQENQPQVSADTHGISVLPPGFSENWEKMSGWTGPHVRTFQLEVKNWLGKTNARFEYKVVYYANGSLNGKGAYLANLQVVPTVVDVPYGFKFDVRFEAGDIINVGTPEDPVAGVQFQLQWRLHSAMKRLQGIDSYFVSGDSEMTVID